MNIITGLKNAGAFAYKNLVGDMLTAAKILHNPNDDSEMPAVGFVQYVHLFSFTAGVVGCAAVCPLIYSMDVFVEAFLSTSFITSFSCSFATIYLATTAVMNLPVLERNEVVQGVPAAV